MHSFSSGAVTTPLNGAPPAATTLPLQVKFQLTSPSYVPPPHVTGDVTVGKGGDRGGVGGCGGDGGIAGGCGGGGSDGISSQGIDEYSVYGKRLGV